MLDETTKLLHVWIPKEAVQLYLYYAGHWNKQTQIEFYEKKKLNLHCNFVDVVQSKRTNLADGNDNIASSSFIASSFISNKAESAVSTSQIELQTGTFNLAIIESVD